MESTLMLIIILNRKYYQNEISSYTSVLSDEFF